MKSRVKQASRRAGLSSSDELEVCERFVSGASAGIIAQSSIYPLEVLKTKLCVRKTGEYTNVWDCILKTYRRDGLIAFYRGYVPNIVGIIPYAGIDLTIYETLKKHFIRRMKERQAAITATAAPLQGPVASTTAFPVPSNNHRNNGHREAGDEPVPGVLLLLACGTISSTCGQLVSYPLALIRTRLQAHPKHEHEVNWLRMVSNIWDEEGFRGLYRGLVPNFLKVAPAVSVSYVVYEYTRRALGVRQ
jgi:solute carrier family 25 phosphate transporter 23/24/25/41